MIDVRFTGRTIAIQADLKTVAEIEKLIAIITTLTPFMEPPPAPPPDPAPDQGGG